MELTERPRSSLRGLRALTLAGASLFVMAVLAAVPGSPYQPILTPNGQPGGPLRILGNLFGLDRLGGNWSVAFGVLVMIAATAAFLIALREAWRGTISVRAIVIAVIAAHIVLLFLPLLFSRDVYSYAFYGRIAGIYGANPYVQTPLDHSSDMLWNFVGPKWVDTPAVYGPAFITLSSFMARVWKIPVDQVEAYRLLAIAASLATCGVIAWTARRLRPERTAFAIAAFGLNPVVLFHSVASGHNDILVALSVIGALALVLAGKERAAVAALTLGALVKATAFLPLILLIVWCVARHPAAERRRELVITIGIALGVGLVFALPYVQASDPSLGMVELATHEGWLAPSAGVERLIDVVTFGTLGWLARVAFGAVLVTMVVALAREVWHRGSSTRVLSLGGSWAWALVLLTLLGPVLLPWYPVWALPLAWLAPRAARTAIVATASVMGVTLWSAEALRFPGAFDLNLFVGRFIVTPVLLGLLAWVIADLRDRIRDGGSFGDEGSDRAPILTSLSKESTEPQRVPQPAG